MASYTFTCSQGHDPVTFGPVDAETDDEAVTKLAELSQSHVAEAHPEMANMPADQAAGIIKANLTKA